MQQVFVLDQSKKPLMPCHPARARELLRRKKVAVLKLNPFTIILFNRTGGDKQPLELKFDPGSKTTGIAIVIEGGNGLKAIWGANLFHRGESIKKGLLSRRAIRRSRRNRKTRYREPRFLNRTRPKGWLAPSLISRVDNINNWTFKIRKLAPITSLSSELVRFDMQKLRNPEIEGVEYQQGSLFGYELKEYLLLKWKHRCAYCSKKDIPLEVEHIVPKSKGGSDSITNLTIACSSCNQKKSNTSIEVFLKSKPSILRKIKAQTKTPLKDAAAINSIRYAIIDSLKDHKLPLLFGTGGQTKFNRIKQGYKKEHWIDAVCVGSTGKNVEISENFNPLIIKATRRGSRQMCRVDKYGFPRTASKTSKIVKGFSTGDMVKAVVTKGKKIGVYFGKVAIRTSGSFNIQTKSGIVQGIGWKYCRLLQKADGYQYMFN